MQTTATNSGPSFQGWRARLRLPHLFLMAVALTAACESEGCGWPKGANCDPCLELFEIKPSRITAGQSTTFRIRLDKEAPQETTVAFESNTQTGVTDTVVNAPLSFKFVKGAREVSLTIETTRKWKTQTHINYYAWVANGKKLGQTLLID